MTQNQPTVPLSTICEKAGVSRQTASRLLSGFNPHRAPFGHHRFLPEQVPDVLAFLASKRQRHRLNRFNAVPREVKTQ